MTITIANFKVKEMSLSQRLPSMETSMYEMNWYPTLATDDNENLHEYEKIIIISFKNMSTLASVTTGLAEIGIPDEYIDLHSIAGGDNVAEFQKEISQKVNVNDAGSSKILVINLLPLAVNACSVLEELSMTANWLSFESNLEILKVLSKGEMEGSILVAFTCQSFGFRDNLEVDFPMPWAATVLGMARAVNLETGIPLIPIDFGKIPSDAEVKKALLSLNLRSIEEGLVIARSTVHQPLLQRLKVTDSKVCKVTVVEQKVS